MKKFNTALASLVVITALGTPAFALQDQKPQPTQPAPTCRRRLSRHRR